MCWEEDTSTINRINLRLSFLCLGCELGWLCGEVVSKEMRVATDGPVEGCSFIYSDDCWKMRRCCREPLVPGVFLLLFFFLFVPFSFTLFSILPIAGHQYTFIFFFFVCVCRLPYFYSKLKSYATNRQERSSLAVGRDACTLTVETR